MNFRQRIAWVMVAAYLLCSCGLVYYVFDINDHYNTFALEHVEQYHGAQGTSIANGWGILNFFHHLMDIPLPIWIVILVLPYLQVFCMLLACTKSDPHLSMAYLWPIYIVLRVRACYLRCAKPPEKAVNSLVPNGHVLIDT